MRLLACLAVALVAAGCAFSGGLLSLPPGTSRDEVVARAGQPTRIVPLPGGGQRLQYSLQPLGREAYMADFDASGRLLRVRQVLTAALFERIEPGKWTRDDVEREFGPPAWVDGVASWRGSILTYRWSDGSDMFYWIYLDPAGVVQRAHPGMEFVNAPNDRE